MVMLLVTQQTFFFIELGLNDTSTLVGHFVSSPREGRRETEEIVEEMKERNRGERKMNASEDQNK